MSYQNILVENLDAVCIITLNRPEALNALSIELMSELRRALEACEGDSKIGAIVLTGSNRAFAAGADIAQMHGQSAVDAFLMDFGAHLNPTVCVRKPIIAAVAGYALGGGCELALACDFIIAADTARFGQPEITLGTLPGAGGTQRLARAIGKAKTMDLVLTGRMMDAQEAERSGLVARVVPAAELRAEALKAANTIAAMSRPAAVMAKEAVNAAFESGLAEGLRLERRLFQMSFGHEDCREGMAAFREKRKPQFRHR
ncbi:MAG: enoyl-CoA hydratase [Proteobacteria bacterium]|nr:enoyl-CoA hydratase [Pseudomonadota bacterium]